MDFESKVVLVTGAGSGIGQASAEEFARRGARVALLGLSEEKLRATAQRCVAFHGKEALPIVVDLTNDEDCEKAAKTALDYFKRVDVLVNTAGIGGRDRIEGANLSLYDKVFAINVRAVYNMTRLLVPAIIQTKGIIINISSPAATMVHVGSLPYSMSKAAIEHFTRLTALELAAKGVRVNCVSPGFTKTAFQKTLFGFTDEQYNQWVAKIEPTIPLGRTCEPSDIAKMIVHLSSDDCRMVTGDVVQVDGGARFNSAASNVTTT